MEEHPDSALRILMSINRTCLGSRDLPYYALLLTQAQVKTDEPVDSDSLISIAYMKYADDWRGDKGIRSSFYMGEVFFNREKPRDAMRHYLTAYEESKRLYNDYWLAKSAERIADLFFNAYNYGEAAKYRREAIDFFGKSNRYANMRYAIADLATDYLNDSKTDEAVMLLDSVFAIVERENPSGSTLLDYIRRMRIGAMISVGRTNELKDEDRMFIEESMSSDDGIDSKILKIQTEYTDSSHKLNEKELKEVLQSSQKAEDKVRVLYACYSQLKKPETNSLERELIDSMMYIQSAVAENIIKESALGAERDFYLNLAVKKQQESRLHLSITLFAILLAGIIAAVFSLFLRLRNLAHKSELEAKVESILNLKAYSDKIAAEKIALSLEISESSDALASLRQKVEEQESIIRRLGQDASDNKRLIENMEKERDDANLRLDILSDRIKQEADLHDMHIKALHLEFEKKNDSRNVIIESLFKNKWSTLNRLCEEYFEKGALRKFQQLLVRDIEAEVRKIGSEEGLHQIEEEVDQYMDGIVAKLRTECTNLKDRDFILCSLIFAEFSVKAICFILNITTNNYYVRKKRLIQKIRDTDTIHKDFFLHRLS
ncbi:MAG: hypothetical protein K2I92_03030 [Muribaculaceae bacterium]|nr:hypothetical protein [Muribaculaceae bacterium]